MSAEPMSPERLADLRGLIDSAITARFAEANELDSDDAIRKYTDGFVDEQDALDALVAALSGEHPEQQT